MERKLIPEEEGCQKFYLARNICIMHERDMKLCYISPMRFCGYLLQQ